jgi:hypothetical protein
MANLNASVDVDPAHAVALGAVFGVTPGSNPVAAIEPQLAGIAKAAFEEYLLHMTGERVPSGVRDLRELRLRLLAEHLPGGLPSDVQVARLFHLTPSQARNLVAGARARYPTELQISLDKAAIAALRAADKGDNDDVIRITAPDSLAVYLRDVVTAASSAQVPIKRTDASNRYDVGRRAVEVLCAHLGIPITDVKNLAAKT